METLRKFAAHGLGIAFLALAFCFAPARTHALGRVTAHAANRAKTHKSTKASHKSAKSAKPVLRKASYKTAGKTSGKTVVHRKRRRRSRRHHITLPKQPAADRTEEIQSALERPGFYAGDPSYKWDSKTQDALRRFQSANGLPATGKLDALSLQKLGLGSDIAGLGAPRAVTPTDPLQVPPATPPSTSAAPKTPGL